MRPSRLPLWRFSAAGRDLAFILPRPPRSAGIPASPPGSLPRPQVQAELSRCKRCFGTSPCPQPLPNPPPLLGGSPAPHPQTPTPQAGSACGRGRWVGCLGPWPSGGPGRCTATRTDKGPEAQRAATLPPTLRSVGAHAAPAPCRLSSRTCSSGDRTPPVPLVLEGLTVSRSQPWWVSSLDQLSPRWVQQCQASPASLVTQQEPPVKPAGCLSTSSTPPGSLVPRRLGGPAGMLPAPPHSLGPGCGEGYGAGGGEGGRPTAWTWEQSGG